jgi:hypothetical protein
MHQGDNTGGPLWYWGWVLAYDGCAGGGGSDDSSSGGSGDSSTSGSDSGSDSGTSTGNTGTSGSSNAPGGGSSSTGNTVITSPNSGLSPKQYQFLKQLNPLSAGDTFGQLDETTQNHVLTYVNGLSANLAINTTAHFFNTTNMLWLINQSAATQVSIVDYLIQNNFSSSSTTFINNLINLAENNDSVEIVPYASSNVMNFQNTSEFNNYVQDLLTDNLTDNTSSSGLDLGSQFSTSKIVEVTNIHDVKFDLVINKSPFSLAQCNSYLYNTIPGNSWVQSTSAMSSTATSATVTIVGYINVGVNLGGNNGAIGIKFSKRIRLFVSTNNGAINGSWVQND